MSLTQIMGLANNAAAFSQNDLLEQMFGEGVASLSKALPLTTNGVGGVSGASLIGEDLSNVLKWIVQKPGDFAPFMKRWWFFQALSLLAEETIVSRLSRGSNSTRTETGLGPTDAPVIERIQTPVKFRGKTFSVSHAMQLIGSRIYGDVKALVSYSLLMAMIMEGERDFLWGDTALDPLNIDGLFKQNLTDADHLVDLSTKSVSGTRPIITGGGALNLEHIINKMPVALGAGGIHTAMALSPFEKVSLGINENTKERWIGESAVVPGLSVEQITQHFGDKPLDLVWHKALMYERGRENLIPIDPADPYLHPSRAKKDHSAPVVTPQAGGYMKDDTYYYGIAAVNNLGGEGEIVMQSAGVIIDPTNGQAELVWNHGTDPTVKSYRIFRSTINGTDRNKMVFLTEVPKSGATSQTWVDEGILVPGSRKAVMMNEAFVSVPQLEAPKTVDMARNDFSDVQALNWSLGLRLSDKGRSQVQFSNIGGSVANAA